MRKSIDGLSALVEAGMELSPYHQAILVFCNRNKDKIEMLVWERNGFVVWYKRLENQRFVWIRPSDDVISVDGKMLNQLLDGLNIWPQKAHETLYFNSVL